MPVQVIEFYEVSDVYSEDGRGTPTVIARITDHDEAFRYAKGKGYFAGDASVRPRTITIVDKALEMEVCKKNNGS